MGSASCSPRRIPLAYREKYDAGVAEARARLNASKADLRAAQDTALD